MNYKYRLNIQHKLVIFFLFLCSYAMPEASGIKSLSLIEEEVIPPSTSAIVHSHSLYYKGANVLFSNPAMYAFAKKNTTIFALNFKTDALAISAMEYLGSQKKDKPLLNLFADTKNFSTNSTITGPISFAFINKNFGFGLFNTSRVAGYLPSLSHFVAFAGEELVMLGGYGGTIYEKNGHEIALGIGLKGFLQAYAYMQGTMFDASLRFLEKQFDALPILFQSGLGINVGFAYRYKEIFTLGLSCKNLYTPVFVSLYKDYKDFFAAKKLNGYSSYKTQPIKLNTGFSIKAISEGRFNSISELTFYFDWHDILSFIPTIRRNYFLNFTFGSELIFHKVLSMRFGIMDLYPQAGIGLDFYYFKLNCSVYAKELGLNVWQRPAINIELGIHFDI